MADEARPRRVLFVCTGNSARSQIAEALLNRKAAGRFVAESAGSQPAGHVNPYVIGALKARGLDWGGRQPRSIEAVASQAWDLVITVCDNARESCPIFPGQPALAHWGMPDPALVGGPAAAVERAFEEAVTLLGRRIDLLLALPPEKLEHLAFQQRVRSIATEAPVPTPPRTA